MEPVDIMLALNVARAGVQCTAHVKQCEQGSRQLRVRLQNGAEPLPLAGVQCSLRALKPDGTAVFADCTVEGGYVKRLLSAPMLAAAGVLRCELNVVSAQGQTLYSPEFQLIVEEAPIYADSIITSSNDFSALTAAIASCAQLQNIAFAATSLPSTAQPNVTSVYSGGRYHVTLGIPQGKPGFAYDDFTAEQLAALKGEKGDPRAAVVYDAAQSLSAAQKAQVRANISVPDIEVGTWPARFYGSTTAGTWTPKAGSQTVGKYCRIGKLVFMSLMYTGCLGQLEGVAGSLNAAGSLYLDGFPWPLYNATALLGVAPVISSAAYPVTLCYVSNTAVGFKDGNGSMVNAANVQHSLNSAYQLALLGYIM